MTRLRRWPPILIAVAVLFLISPATAAQDGEPEPDGPEQGFADQEPGDRDIAEMFYNEGLRDYILGDYADAIADFDAAARLQPDSETYQTMYLNALVKQGSAEFESGDLQAAARRYREALAASGSDPELARRLELIRSQLAADTAAGAPASADPNDPVRSSPDAPPGGQPPAVVEVEWPFDIEEFIERQNAENRRMLDEVLRVQREERENLYRSMELMAETQREDRTFLGRSLTLAVAGIGALVFLPLLAVVIVVILRLRSNARGTHDAPPTARIAGGPASLPGAAEELDESEHVDRENYSQIARATNLRDLYQELANGNVSWDVVSAYIDELNDEVKNDVLSAVERKLATPSGVDAASAVSVLMSLVTDESEQVRSRSKHLADRIASPGSSIAPLYSGDAAAQLEQLSENDDPLDVAALLQIARLVDRKSGFTGHSVRVAKYASRIAGSLADPSVIAQDAERVALVHNVGYLDIHDVLFRQETLSETQFEVIKSHTERGPRLIAYANPPAMFVDGIRCHHERRDGSGYPAGLRGEEIPLIARIIAVADVFAALTSQRPYRNALSADPALEWMEKTVTEGLDPDVFRALSDVVSAESEDTP